MRFLEHEIPPKYRRTVDAFKRAVQEACENAALARTTVEVRSDGEREFVVFTLNDPLGGRPATVQCDPGERPDRIGRRAYAEAARMLYGARA